MTAIVVDIYCRVSTDPQEDNSSLDEQEAIGREYCRAQGLTVGMVHRETFTGYKYRERKKLSLMRERYREGTIQGVVIRTLDRLSRSQTHVAILMEEMEHYGVALHSIKEVIDDTPMGKFARMVLAFVAEMEREKILDRTVAGKITKAQAGKVVSGHKPPYGWKWTYDDKGARDTIVIDEDQVAVLLRAAEAYVDGQSFERITRQLDAEGVPTPKGKRWYPRTLRKILTGPRMTGTNIQIFTQHKKNAKQPLEPVAMPDGTFPRILSDELYAKVVERAARGAAQATRNSKYPEKFLLRAGFAHCAYCGHTMMAKRFYSHGNEWFAYSCPNRASRCSGFCVPAAKLDTVVWETVEQLADHIAIIEQSVRLAMDNRSLDDDLRATEAALTEWRAKVANYEDDLTDSTLHGSTRQGIRHLLDAARGMVEDLEQQHAELMTHSLDHDKVHAEYEKVLAWCKQVKSERGELTYHQKRDFLCMLGTTVIVYKQEAYARTPPVWDIRVALPKVQELIYQGDGRAFGGATSRGWSELASLLHS